MRWLRRGRKMVPLVVAAVVGVSCGGDDSTAPPPPPPPSAANVQFGFGDIDLQAGRDTVVQISNTGGSPSGPIQLVPLPVRDAAGSIVSGPSLQVTPSDIATLNPGTSVSVALSVSAPADTPNGDYQVGLEARSQNQLLASAVLRFQVTNGPGGPAANTVTITGGPTAFIRGDVVQFTAEVRDSVGTVLPNEPVQWSVGGFGLFDTSGRFVSYSTGAISIIAQSGAGANTLSVTVADRTLLGTFSTLGHGVVDPTTSDLWVHGGVLYSGTWNGGGGTFYTWSLANPDQPVKSDSLTIDASVVNDVKIRSDGTLGVITHEGSSDDLNGVTLIDLTVPDHPTIITRYTTGLEVGVHNVWIEGNFLYVVTDGGNPTTGGLRILDVSNPAAPTQVAQFYGGASFLHDVYLADGLAFLSHWSQGLIILDVGNGIAGGSPTNPVEVARLQIPGFRVHNAWYWPTAGYVFLGDEIKTAAGLGRMMVVDVSDLQSPVVAASFSATGEAPHNFWLDESRGILYAAWYSHGLRALDVNGTLMGELERQGRQIARAMYDAGNTLTWAPQLDNGRIYLSDMFSGVWVLQGNF